MLLTVFTPTYNRGYILSNLYNSLLEQTSKEFEWVIVDDGSTDDTEELVRGWIEEHKIPIRYFLQENAGKPAAHNRGVQETRGYLFTCVDSDDYLTRDAVSRILETWNGISSEGYTGVIAFRAYPNGEPITRLKDRKITSSKLRDAYKKHGLSGDTMLVFRTDVIRKYSFPHIEGEKFIPEGYLYNQLDDEGTLYILREALYICEYLEDGYSQNVDKLIFDNYRSYALHISERIRKYDDNWKDIILDSMRYSSVLIAHREKNIIRNSQHKFITALTFFPSYLVAMRRFKKLMK